MVPVSVRVRDRPCAWGATVVRVVSTARHSSARTSRTSDGGGRLGTALGIREDRSNRRTLARLLRTVPP